MARAIQFSHRRKEEITDTTDATDGHGSDRYQSVASVFMRGPTPNEKLNGPEAMARPPILAPDESSLPP